MVRNRNELFSYNNTAITQLQVRGDTVEQLLEVTYVPGKFNPTTCKVKIYTAAGRLVREINTPGNVRYSNIHWDGKDNDVDFIANGVYLYKFIIQGDSQVETSIQKFAILR